MVNTRQKWVLISGAAGGIGKATVEVFSEHGWKVVAVDRKEFTWPDFAAVHVIQADISNPDDIAKIFSRTEELTPTLDAVINNASIQVVKPLLETSVDEWDQVMESNLRSVFLGARLAHPLLKVAGGGAIVNVSSVHAVATSANIAAYAASKGGLLALTRAMAIEFAPDNIRVNAILPGAVDTPMLRAGLQRGQFGGSELDRLENLARKTVNGRVGQPAEIAACIYFLADNDQSSFMTGQALVVDGGATARLSTE